MEFKQANEGNYAPGRSEAIRYIVVHYTGNDGDTAQNNLDYAARAVTKTSAHYYVDETSVRQSVKDADTAWHCGSSSPRHPECRNSNSIGVEMCNSLHGVSDAVRDRTAAFVRELMDKYQVPPKRVLRHYDVTGKKCPAPWVDDPGQWAKFKSMLEDDDMLTQEQFNQMMAEYERTKNPVPDNTPADWEAPAVQWARDNGLLAGDGSGNLMLHSNMTRAQFLVMLKKYHEKKSEIR